jgi:hypothetical protein
VIPRRPADAGLLGMTGWGGGSASCSRFPSSRPKGASVCVLSIRVSVYCSFHAASFSAGASPQSYCRIVALPCKVIDVGSPGMIHLCNQVV